MDTEKVLGNAARRLMKATGETIKDQREKSRERAAERARQAAARRAYEAQMMGEATASYNTAMEAVNTHNATYRNWKPIKLASDPIPVKKCSFSTSFWDCEDPNCYHHADEKTKRGVGTPTRNFHTDFQTKAPKDPASQLLEDLFGQN